MKYSKVVSIQSIRQTVLMCICAMAIHGCSGSSSSGSGEIENGGESTAVTVNGDNGTENDGSDTTEVDGVSESPVAVEESESTESGEPPVIVQPAPVVTEPSAPATIRVDFDITVPAYMSDELQVRLTWGNINTTAAWVQDENWVISETFPANSENLLVVTFADQNGAIALGTFESTFRTGTEVSELVQISVNEFDTGRWDNDNDGISNLDELIAGTNPAGGEVPQAVQASLELVPAKTFRITWQGTPDAQAYRVLENRDGVSGFTDISGELDTSTTNFDHLVALYSRVNAQYLVQSCNEYGCTDSEPVMVTGTLDDAIGYFKASNPENQHRFGQKVSLSADGSTLVVSTSSEGSNSTGINGPQFNNSAPNSGAVYVFFRGNGLWQQQAYIKASNAEEVDRFGSSISLSADGNTLVVGAFFEDSAATSINGDQSDNSALRSGAAYVFVRSGDVWQQQAYLKASNAGADDRFGAAVSLSADGNTIAIGAPEEDSAAVAINGEQSDNTKDRAGAVYVFVRSDNLWQQQAYLKASNSDELDGFGVALSLNSNGNTLVVGASGEDSSAPGINGNQSDNSVGLSGAVYAFVRSDGLWQQQAYVKASNPGARNGFGSDVSLNSDGNILAVGASGQASAAVGINGEESDTEAPGSGAAYVFVRNDELWQQQAFVKSSNTANGQFFGQAVSLSADGSILAVGSIGDRSSATGINGDQSASTIQAGAAYVFSQSNGLWQQMAYVKASNTEREDFFGGSVNLSADGNTLAVGAVGENSSATGFNGDQNETRTFAAGAVYLY